MKNVRSNYVVSCLRGILAFVFLVSSAGSFAMGAKGSLWQDGVWGTQGPDPAGLCAAHTHGGSGVLGDPAYDAELTIISFRCDQLSDKGVLSPGAFGRIDKLDTCIEGYHPYSRRQCQKDCSPPSFNFPKNSDSCETKPNCKITELYKEETNRCIPKVCPTGSFVSQISGNCETPPPPPPDTSTSSTSSSSGGSTSSGSGSTSGGSSGSSGSGSGSISSSTGSTGSSTGSTGSTSGAGGSSGSSGSGSGSTSSSTGSTGSTSSGGGSTTTTTTTSGGGGGSSGDGGSTTTTTTTTSGGGTSSSTTSGVPTSGGTSGSTPSGTPSGSPSGTPSGTPSGEPDSKDLCQKNPGLNICKNSTVSGACESVSCDGDAITCAILRTQQKRDCEDHDSSNKHFQAGQALLDGVDPLRDSLPSVKNALEVDVSKTVQSESWAGGGSCVVDKVISVRGISITVPLSSICPYLIYLRFAIMLLASLSSFYMLSSAVLRD